MLRWHGGTKLQTSSFFLQAVKKMRMIMKDETAINDASPVWQENLSEELSKCAEFRKHRVKEKVRVVKEEIAQLASHPPKVQGVSLPSLCTMLMRPFILKFVWGKVLILF